VFPKEELKPSLATPALGIARNLSSVLPLDVPKESCMLYDVLEKAVLQGLEVCQIKLAINGPIGHKVFI